MTEEMKIGEVARFVLKPLLESGKISEQEIENLKDANYCKKHSDFLYPCSFLTQKRKFIVIIVQKQQFLQFMKNNIS